MFKNDIFESMGSVAAQFQVITDSTYECGDGQMNWSKEGSLILSG